MSKCSSAVTTGPGALSSSVMLGCNFRKAGKLGASWCTANAGGHNTRKLPLANWVEEPASASASSTSCKILRARSR